MAGGRFFHPTNQPARLTTEVNICRQTGGGQFAPLVEKVTVC